MLGRVHDGLRGYGGALPGWLGAVDHARATLADDDRMAALPADDLHLLRTSFDTWAARLRDRTTPERPLHGEPHLGNVVVTADGPVLIDFEGASTGPPEWDLASLPPGVADRYGGVDGDRLALARLLDSARVATWGWAYAEHPTMRRHGEHHLAVVRRAHER
jgi:aminoglycoside phosphotransferase (APT) family kinase protein